MQSQVTHSHFILDQLRPPGLTKAITPCMLIYMLIQCWWHESICVCSNYLVWL